MELLAEVSLDDGKSGKGGPVLLLRLVDAEAEAVEE